MIFFAVESSLKPVEGRIFSNFFQNIIFFQQLIVVFFFNLIVIFFST